MNSAQAKDTSAGGFELDGLEGRRLLSFVFVSTGGGLVFSVGSGSDHHHHVDHHHHHHHTGVSVTVTTVDHTHLDPATDAFQTLFPTHFPALPMPSFMPMH